ncbi:ankyrin-1-like [Artemia franciscana]
MSNPFSKAVNRKKKKTHNLNFQNSSAFVPVKAECIPARLLGSCSCKIEPSRKSSGRASLHDAAADGKLDMCQLHLSKGAYMDTLDLKGYTPLHWAAKTGQISVANYFLEKGANLHLRSKNSEDCGKTPLHFAAAEGKLEMCHLLVSKGAHIDSLDDKRLTPLHWAVKEEKIVETRKKGEDKLEIVKLLLSRGANTDMSDKYGLLPLHYAAKRNNLDIFQLLYSETFTLTLTSLHWAAEEGQIPVATYLLEKGGIKLLENLNLMGLTFTQDSPLHTAATNGELGICQLLVSKGAHINIGYSRTPLHFAAREGHISVAKYLLRKGANPNFQCHGDHYGYTPLHAAAQRGKLDMCQLLVSKGARIDALYDNCHTPLFSAVRNGQLSVVSYLIEKGANINFQIPKANVDFKNTPLHSAAAEGQIDMCQLLVSKGAQIDILDDRRRTPLHWAVVGPGEDYCTIKEENKTEIVKFLLSRGASTDILDKHGRTPLHYAAKANKLDICRLLVSKGAQIDILDDERRNPLHWAVIGSGKAYCTMKSGDEAEIVKFLLSRGAPTDILDENGLAPLHYAAKANKLDSCQLLVSKGAQTDILDDEGFTPFHLAFENNNISIASYLLEKGANINLKYGNSPLHSVHHTLLHSAAAQCQLDKCQFLLSKGAQVDALDDKRRTPLHCVVNKTGSFTREKQREKLEIVKFLISRGATVDVLDENDLTPLVIAVSKRDFAIADYLLEKKAIYHPPKTENYRVLLKDLINSYFTIEEAAKTKIYSILCNLAFRTSNDLKSICRYVIVNYACQTKLFDYVEGFNIPHCLKCYLNFEEELQLCFKN